MDEGYRGEQPDGGGVVAGRHGLQQSSLVMSSGVRGICK